MRRPPGWLAVVTTPAGLCSTMWMAPAGPPAWPSTATASSSATWVPTAATLPLTVTRPAGIRSSAARRDAHTGPGQQPG